MEIKYILKEDKTYTVGEILSKKLKISRRIITRLKKDNGIFLNGNPVFTNRACKAGDEIKVIIKDEKSSAGVTPENIPIEVIYEDDYIFAVNKKRGMPVHPTLNYKNGTLANAVMYRFKDENFIFRPINRLDKDTSGIILIAKNQYSAEIFGKMIKTREIEKKYIAIVCKTPENNEGEIQAPIERDLDSIIKRKVAKTGANSITKYRIIKKGNEKTLIEAIPLTGRTHQIRVHMAYIGNPLYADFLYGEEINGETFYLHCNSVSFIHPFTGKKTVIECKLPKYFEKHFNLFIPKSI